MHDSSVHIGTHACGPHMGYPSLTAYRKATNPQNHGRHRIKGGSVPVYPRGDHRSGQHLPGFGAPFPYKWHVVTP